MAFAKVILLNGASSSGKSSIGRALQERFEEPWLLIGVDAFLPMMPAKYFGHDAEPGSTGVEGFNWRPIIDERGKTFAIEAGPFGERLILEVMHPAIAAAVANGHNVIIDDVLLESAWLVDYLKVLNGFETWFVLVDCPLDVLEAREASRGDRDIGQARWQHERVHWAGAVYDAAVDTSLLSPKEASAAIDEAVARPPAAFDEMRRSFS